jgi:signal transduction histidine kinase
VTGILYAFLKPQQEYQEATEAKVGTLETEVADLNEKVTHYTERVADQGKEIERLGATAQRILNNVNHELRLPVGNVMNFAEMLNDGLGKFNERQLKMLSDEVYKNSNRLSSMIMNMLDLATLEAKKIELSKSKINFGELVRDRVQLCRKMYLGNKKIDFEMRIEEDVFVNVDPNYIRQTVDNLVINAINFSREGTIRISALRKGNFVEFTIEDEGIGIPKEELYDIFTPFKMGSNAASKAEGRGVGLALCKAAIEAHGGSVTAESKSGKGARFRFLV